jgi:hypothetical protein
MAFLALIPSWLRTVIICAAIGIAAFAAGHWRGEATERADARLEAHEEALQRIQNMEKNNADFLGLPDRERCLVFMRDSGLPDSACDGR